MTGKTIPLKRLAGLNRRDPADVLELAQIALERPRTRGECAAVERPCPFASCRFHIAYDVTGAGGLKENFPGRELEDLPETCALDVADRGGVTLQEVGRLLGLTKERVRQIERVALRKLEAAA